MRVRNGISIIVFLVLLISCTSLDQKFVGLWQVDKVYLHGEPAVWNLYSNAFDLNEDHSCELPIWDWEDRRGNKEKGKWETFEKNDSIYLKIETDNELFNRIFFVENLTPFRDLMTLGYGMKMTIVSDSLRFDCTGINYETDFGIK